jgi:hypothetical protein
MNILHIKPGILFIAIVSMLSLGSCYKLQTDYKYVKKEADPNINATAKQYLFDRSDNLTPGAIDTVFRWMKKGIEYAGIDMAEYEKPGRTYIFLHNSAIRVIASGKVTGGFFFDYPIIEKDAGGNPIRNADGTIKSHPATKWEEYAPETVKNYFLSLIIEGVYGFDNLHIENQSLPTLLPANTPATKESRLGYVVPSVTPDPNNQVLVVLNFTDGGNGFDPEGKINLKIANITSSPIRLNDKTDDRSAGYIATNGQLHVYGATVHPFRYSHL